MEIDIGANYNIICPVIGDFCTDWEYRCPLDCSANGICLQNNTCFCFNGFTGDDCVLFFRVNFFRIHVRHALKLKIPLS